MKYAAMVVIAILLFGCGSESVAQCGSQDVEVQVTVSEDPKVLELRRLEQLWGESMEVVIEETLSYEAPIWVTENEKGYHIGYISLKSDGEMRTGYGGGAPIDVSIDSVVYDFDQVVFTLKVSNVRINENTGERELYYSGLVEVILTKDRYLSTLKAYASGESPSRRFDLVGTIIQAPGTVN